ncbi:MAG: MOSC domain-containing protein [bacterium]
MSAEVGTVGACVVGLQRSRGGVPKHAVDRAMVTVDGMEGDWQRERRFHGGPDRALCIYSMELIDALAAEGHPISAGSVGENVTVRGVVWPLVRPGARLLLGDVEVEITSFTVPCKTIAGAFLDGRSVRISEKVNPGWSRVYARVLRGGAVAVGDAVELVAQV